MKTLICTAYGGDANKLAVYKLSPDKVILLSQKTEDENAKNIIKNGINKIKTTFGELAKIEIRIIEEYDVEKIIRETVRIIDQEHEQGNEITLHISEGRKTQTIACLLAAYKRKNKIRSCYYFTEDTEQALQLPILDFSIPEAKKGILEQVNKGETNIAKIYKKMRISKALAYKLFKELKQEGFIEENKLTQTGRIAIL